MTNLSRFDYLPSRRILKDTKGIAIDNIHIKMRILIRSPHTPNRGRNNVNTADSSGASFSHFSQALLSLNERSRRPFN
jgi:hypothetical protein